MKVDKPKETHLEKKLAAAEAKLAKAEAEIKQFKQELKWALKACLAPYRRDDKLIKRRVNEELAQRTKKNQRPQPPTITVNYTLEDTR
jgi:phytoene/squalene synthetase